MMFEGKTFSAEATGDYVKRPLYVIGGGDLGTAALDVEDALVRAFKLATAWKAIVLIDEVRIWHAIFSREIQWHMYCSGRCLLGTPLTQRLTP